MCSSAHWDIIANSPPSVKPDKFDIFSSSGTTTKETRGGAVMDELLTTVLLVLGCVGAAKAQVIERSRFVQGVWILFFLLIGVMIVRLFSMNAP